MLHLDKSVSLKKRCGGEGRVGVGVKVCSQNVSVSLVYGRPTEHGNAESTFEFPIPSPVSLVKQLEASTQR